jgi:flagellar protein FlaI
MKIPQSQELKKLVDAIEELISIEDSRSQIDKQYFEELSLGKINSKQLAKKLKEKKEFANSKNIDIKAISQLVKYSQILKQISQDLEIEGIDSYTLKTRNFIKSIIGSKKKTTKQKVKRKALPKQIHKEIPVVRKTVEFKQKKPTKKKINILQKAEDFADNILKIIGLSKLTNKSKKEIKEKEENEEIISKFKRPKFEEPAELKPENYQMLIPGYAYAFIDEKKGKRTYVVAEPELTKDEKRILEEVKTELINKISLIDIKEEASLFKQVNKIFRNKKIKLDKDQKSKIVYYIARQIKGLDKIEPLMHDPLIEDIEGDGVGIPIFIVHRKYGHIETNIVFESEKELQEFVTKMAHLCKSYVSYASPLLDAILPDGSRVNATLTSNVSTRGPTFTIRKFPQKPLTAIDLINSDTINSTLVAYLWTVIEFKKTIIIVGPTAAGKTTLLNVITSFIPPGQRVVSIEDTREINLLMNNWIPQITRPGFGPPDAQGKKYGEVTMNDLLKESFRQRPDFLIIGEVRGQEMSMMFQGMASGHCCISTIHSKSVDNLVNRLITPPISLEPSLLTSLDIVIVIGFSGSGESKRAIKEIDEIRGFNVKENKIEYNAVYNVVEEINKKEGNELFTDELPITYRSEILKDISREHGIKLNELLEVIKKRKSFIDDLLKRDKPPKDYVEFKLELNKYKTKENLLDNIR